MNIDVTQGKELSKVRRQLKKAIGIAHINCKWKGTDGACHNKGTKNGRCSTMQKGECPMLSPLDDADTE
jgi:hypothetical protein